MSQGYPMRRLKNGRISVTQHTFGKFEVTFNPDDEKFYITNLETEATAGIFTLYRNAIGFAKRKDRADSLSAQMEAA